MRQNIVNTVVVIKKPRSYNFYKKIMKNKRILVVGLVLVLAFAFPANAQHSRDVIIIDSNHYSNVFEETRNYRIFLPAGYFDTPRKKYPTPIHK